MALTDGSLVWNAAVAPDQWLALGTEVNRPCSAYLSLAWKR